MGACIGLEKDNKKPPSIEMTYSSCFTWENKLLDLTILFFPARKKAWEWKQNNHNFHKRIISHNKQKFSTMRVGREQKPWGDRWPWGHGGKESPSCPLPPSREPKRAESGCLPSPGDSWESQWMGGCQHLGLVGSGSSKDFWDLSELKKYLKLDIPSITSHSPSEYFCPCRPISSNEDSKTERRKPSWHWNRTLMSRDEILGWLSDTIMERTLDLDLVKNQDPDNCGVDIKSN